MFKISISVNIPDFKKDKIEIDCPKCKLHTWATIGQIERNDYIICRGCHTNIFLYDYQSKTKRTFNKITRILKGMEV